VPEHALDTIAGRILLDARFREALIADPDRALSGLGLSECEKAWLKRIDYETVEALAQMLALHLGQIGPENESTVAPHDAGGADEM
jgi:hypothetical protein